MTELDDELEKLRARDPATLRRFWERERRSVHTICARVLGEGLDAREVADGVLIDFMFDYAQRVESVRTVRAYLHMMAARRAIRRRDQRSRNIAEHIDQQVDEQQNSPEETAHLKDVGSAVSECLSKLTPKAQHVLRLRFSADLTQEQIGDLVGGSKQYIGRLLQQSLAALRTCLESLGVVLENALSRK